MGSPLRAGVLTGALFGIMQAIRAAVTGEGAVGVGVGLSLGIPFGAFMGRFASKMTDDLSGLTPHQRAQVGRAVRRGEAPEDPSLAAATIERARRTQEQSQQTWPYLVLGGFALLTLVLAVADAVAGSLATGEVLLVVFWAIFLPVLRWSGVRANGRAQRAEAAARAIQRSDG